MRYIIRDREVVADDWRVLPAIAERAAAALPDGKLIVPLNVWLAQTDALTERKLPIGIWLDSNQDAAEVANVVNSFAVIAVNFPKFADGRGYSIATLLRSRYGYKGELRAIGDVLRDQLFYMQRVGFNAFAVRADKDIHDALKALKDFTVTYQGSVAEPRPLFKRRRIPEAA
ncbi:MAG: DUF934 domain-containing protein [Burkholderiales bacterium]|nr:DUF934 domain-containing protein [Burkholderiales bacterium]